jgi:hypothetical protein
MIWYIFPRFGVLYQEKSGNPDFGQLNFLRLIGLLRGIFGKASSNQRSCPETEEK